MNNVYRLYLVTDDTLDLTTLKHVVREAVKGGVTLVQVREKHGNVRAFIERAQAIKDILQGTGVPLIINDRVDVALAVNADGVHLGQSDMPVTIARQLLGADKILGLSIETQAQLTQAQTMPLDYIALSAIFPTQTKTNTTMYWGVEGLQKTVSMTSLPVVAIGGINEHNISELCATGVDGLALVSAICSADDPQAVSRYFIELMN